MPGLPTTMNAIEITTPGGPEILRMASRPVPAPGAGEVLIRVHAAGVNRPDIVQRQGHYPPPPGASDLPGLEVAGTIAALGEGVASLAVGDAVCALLSGGGYAEYAVAPAPQCLPVPQGLSFAEAAALPETAFTVWTNIMEGGRFASGDTVLVHGGTSGIGVMAIQMVRALGGRVIATAGSDEKARHCEALGAERGINYRTEDFVAVVAEWTAKQGVDIILDMVGGDYLHRNLRALSIGGRIVVIAFLEGGKPPIDLFQIMRKRAILTGSTLRARPIGEKGEIALALRETVWPLIEKGAIKPVLSRIFPLDQAADAHRLMESSAHIGKIVLDIP